MSFLGGTECSSATKPLTQLSKHVQGDRTLQRDRLLGRGRPGAVPDDMRSAGALSPFDTDTDKVRFVIVQSMDAPVGVRVLSRFPAHACHR